MRYTREQIIENPPRKYSNLWKAIELAGLKYEKYVVIPSQVCNNGIQYPARVLVKKDTWGVIIFRDRRTTGRAAASNPMNVQAQNRKIRLAKRKGWPLLEIWPGSVDEMWSAIEKWRLTLTTMKYQLAGPKCPYIRDAPKHMNRRPFQAGERSK